jgi:carboxyl-terminal processing protease
MKPFARSFFFTLIFISSIAASFITGYQAHKHLIDQKISFPILTQAYDLLTLHGYSDVPANPALEYGMIRGMISAYGDPYTSFTAPAQHELETNMLQGVYGGIGVTLGNDTQGFYVLYPYPDCPAANAGILEGDRLLKIDDLMITPETPQDIIQAALRGPVGERVSIIIARPPQTSEIELSIELNEIPLPSVISHLEVTEPKLGIVQINIIAATTHEEILNAFFDLNARGATAYAIDLRNNAGGLLDAGIDISRIFLTSGVVIEQQYRGQPVEVFSVEQPGELQTYPLVILVNQNTASAAEIIAGALQAQDRAILIGAPTFGKDTIQLVFDLDDGSSLHITAAHWWIPGLIEPLAGNGLQPDILIYPDEVSAIDPYIEAAKFYFFKD